MVRSITFDGKEGYIGERYTDEDKPVKPNKNDSKYRTGFGPTISLNEEKYNSDMERYKEEMKAFKKVKGQYKVQCSELLVGRSFEFVPDKINLIFGPNASGKSTLLKGIAAHAFCEDGFSKFVEPLELSSCIIRDHDEYMVGLKKMPLKMAKTSSTVEWDGSPIYYHNFENRPKYGYFGELTGSIIDSHGEEMVYLMDRGRMSGGQDMFYQFSKLAKLMSKTVTYNDLLKPYEKYGKSAYDDNPWRMAYEVQLEHYKSMPMSFNPEGQNTYLFDEIDKSMDILNVHSMYTDILPRLMRRFGKQIIIISHSPIVLKPEIMESENYNFISMEEEYTKKCVKTIF